MNIKTLVVHLPVLVKSFFLAILSLTLSNIHILMFKNIDFVNNNPASFKDAYFDFASICTFTAENPYADSPTPEPSPWAVQ